MGNHLLSSEKLVDVDTSVTRATKVAVEGSLRIARSERTLSIRRPGGGTDAPAERT